jgi:hypothetical protein
MTHLENKDKNKVDKNVIFMVVMAYAREKTGTDVFDRNKGTGNIVSALGR